MSAGIVGPAPVILYDANGNPIVLGQAAKAASYPVVMPSDQWPDAIAQAIFAKLTDGTYGPVAVKDSGVAPVTGDKALVTVLSPNQPPISAKTKIEDGGGSGRLAYVDGANRLLVTANATVVPPASVAVEQSEISDLTGTSDLIYVIPTGKILTITRFAGGAEGNSGKVSRVDLYYDPLGTGAGMTLIRSMYLSGTNWEYGLDYKATGDGTIAIRMRRERLDGASDEVAGFWSGYRDV